MSISDNKIKRHEYIYIVGHGHSGSTLLEITLGNHPDIFAMGEIEKFSLQFARDSSANYLGRCSCGKRPFDCSVWNDVKKDISTQYNIDVKKTPFMFRVSDIGFEEDYGCRAIRHWCVRYYYRLTRYIFYSGLPLSRCSSLLSFGLAHKWTSNRLFVANSLINITKARAVVDSSKDCIGMMDLYEENNVQMKIIFLTRDPRANAWSYVKQGANPIEATRRWVKVNSRINRMLEKIPHTDWIHLRYEDLCRDPVTTCQQLCSFLQYEYRPEMLEFKETLHTIGGNKIRYSPITGIRQDLSWKQSLPSKTISQMDRLYGRKIALLGYDLLG